MKRRIPGLIGIIALCAASGIAAAADSAPAGSGPNPRYTFSWAIDGTNPTPRGGSTRGPAVTLNTTGTPAWHALHETGLTSYERDRRAILTIVGDYRASFDFLEIATYLPGAARDRPYQSWGTERVYVDEDRRDFISLVHILEMRTVNADGSVSEPFVQKHWREDWQYEPQQIVEFKGDNRWQRRAVGPAERRMHWSQTVEQTDESPRYASLGHWEHSADVSTWISGETWRPLPRRESRRSDYQVLLGTNRVTLTVSGWLQEENNLKTALGAGRRPDPEHPYRSREYGVARYERLQNADFAAADQYFRRTKSFWDQVHDAWSERFDSTAQVTLREPRGADDEPYGRLLEYADQVATGRAPSADARQFIRTVLQDAEAPVEVTGQ